MDAIAYLTLPKDLERQIEACTRKIDKLGEKYFILKLSLEKTSGIDYSDDRVQKSPENMMEHGICELDMLKQQGSDLLRQVDVLKMRKATAEEDLSYLIGLIPDRRQRKVLRKIYLQDRTTGQVARELRRSTRWVKMMLSGGRRTFVHIYQKRYLISLP